MLQQISLFSLIFVSVVSAWSNPRRTSHIIHLHHHTRPTTHFFKTQLYSTVSSANTPEVQLSSAYDRNLPAALVGEAVRSALRSDRGICFDFTTDRYGGDQDYDEVSKFINNSRLVSVVKMNGEGTKTFINAKFSQSIPNNNVERIGDVGDQLSSKTKFIRRGYAFETAYLTSKGRMNDRLLVLQFPSSASIEEEDDAFLITSPGNCGSTLYNELSPLVFPMDKVTLTDGMSSSYQTKVITLACSSLKDAQTSFNNNVLKLLMKDDSYSKQFEFPKDRVCHHYRVDNMDSGEATTDVYVLQHTFLSTEICHGYTLLFQQSANFNAPTLADEIWDNLTLEQNDKGPVGVGSLEYDTMRVEAGISGYGSEMTGDGPKKKEQGTRSGVSDDDHDAYYAKSSPLELHLQNLIDTDKGCYQGQEGVASMLKNKRGCPRQLYQAIFYDSENDFDNDDDGVGGYGLLSIDNKELMDFQQLKKQSDPISNDTRQPRPGDNIYVLGSNESIQAGRITSVAQPNGTGDAKTIALALVKRSDSILKSIKEQGLDLPRYWEDFEEENDGDESGSMTHVSNENGGSGIMQPPPLDPLHNLEIVIEGSYTVGRLVSVPSRRYSSKSSGTSSLLDYENRGEVVDAGAPAYVKYEFQEDIVKESQITLEDEENTNDVDELLAKAEEEAAKAAAEAEAAAAEAKRKEEKM